jgi:signal transduction histidine kinase
VKRTLVGRMALVQLVVVLCALAAMVGLSFVAMTVALQRRWDHDLRALCDSGVELSARMSTKKRPTHWLMDELEDHQALGVRVELHDRSGAVLDSEGDGPALLAGGDGCRDQGSYRVCQATAGDVVILAGLSREGGLRDRALFVAVSAAVALILGVLAMLFTRAIARRSLSGLSSMATSIDRLQPGTDRRLPAPADYRELRVLERSFNDLLGRAEQALMMERRFAAEASHELRTPLTVLRAEIEELAGRDGGSGPAARALASVDGLIGLVEALLWLSRSQAPLDAEARALVNVPDLVRDHAGSVAAAYPRHTVEVDAPDELLVQADERLLGRAIANLIDNACKHSRAAGRVAIAVTEVAEDIVVAVSDDGPGVPAELRERIFEPFFRGGAARAETDGFGLGLPLASTVARAHGGTLTLATAPAGSRFVLRLPAYRPPVGPGSDQASRQAFNA